MHHVSVLLEEALEYLSIRPDGMYLDCTAGLGGHTGAIARKLTSGVVVANDRDSESLEAAKANTADVGDRIRFCHGKFSQLAETLVAAGVTQVDGLLADLGVSRYQLTEAERGFSIVSDGPLDMRMDRQQELQAADVVNYGSERELADLLYQLGEERRSRRIASAIVRARPIRGTGHLAQVVEQVVPRNGRLHPATQTFMALRIAVNQEQEELAALLKIVPQLVKQNGRIVFITFMSLEDREVKQAMRRWAQAGQVEILTKHVVTPAEAELVANPPSRSAKLRAAQKTV